MCKCKILEGKTKKGGIKGLLDGDYGFSTAVGLFNTVINVVLLISMNSIVKKLNDGKGV